MKIEQIIFNLVNSSAHNWVRYWKNREISGLTMPGEYIEIRSNYLSKEMLQEPFEAGFKIETILPQKINADSYCDILLKREITD
jgi:hypothetical protein